jgi:hypothetical protein
MKAMQRVSILIMMAVLPATALTHSSGAATAAAAPARITDINGDGVVDIVSVFQAPASELAAYDKTYDGTDGNFGPGYDYVHPGSVSVIYGKSRKVDTVTQQQLGDPRGVSYINVDDTTVWKSNSWTGTFGDALVVADLNADGYSDILVGDPRANHDAGEVWALWGSAAGISAKHSTKLLAGKNAGEEVGTQLAYLSSPTPTLVVAADPEVGGPLSTYPVNGDGTLAAMKPLAPLAAGASPLSADGDLLAIGEPDATVSGVEGAGDVRIMRLLPDGTWASTIVSQDTPGVPGKAEESESFGQSVSIMDGYLAVGVPWEGVGGAVESGQIQPFRVTGTGAAILAKPLKQLTPKNLGLFKTNTRHYLGSSVQVYRICDGKYGVLSEFGAGDQTHGHVLRAPFTKSSGCKARILTTTGSGADFFGVQRPSATGRKADNALLAVRPFSLKFITRGGNGGRTTRFASAQHPEFSRLP